LATVEQDNGDDTYTVTWFDGDESNRTKSSAELKLMRFDADQQTYHEVEASQPAVAEPAEAVAVESVEITVAESPEPAAGESSELVAAEPAEQGVEVQGEADGDVEEVLLAVDDDGNPLLDDEGNLIQVLEEDLEGMVPQEGAEEMEPREPREVGPIGTLTLEDGMGLFINLDRREDRKKAMEELAGPNKWLSANMTRIAAVNGDELSWPQLVGDKLFTLEARIMSQRAANMNLATIADDPDDCSSHLTLGGCGCALSHKKAWQALLDSKAKWALVMEDDLVFLCPNFDDELKAVLQQLPEDFAVCYLGFHTGEPLPEGEHFEGPLVQQEDGWLAGLWCYMISRAGAELMLEHAVPFQAQVDTVVGILAVQDGRCYTVPPGQFLAFSPPTEESLDTDVQTFRVMPETEEEMMEMMEAIAEDPGASQLFSDIALHDAALQGLSDVCMQILGQPESTHDLNARDGCGQTALHAAAWAGLTDVCMAILERPDFTEVNAIDDEGNSVLHAAAFKGLSDVCTKILERSEFTEAAACDCDERTAASLAVEKGHLELAEKLRKHCA